jgi:RNA polymerase sigma-70 factor (ECF subfamily)
LATSILDLSPDQLAAANAADTEDLRLAEGLRAGTETAYEELIQRFQQPVYALAIRLLNDSAGASDVVQEVFLKVFRNIASFRGQSTLRTWIYRITVNEAHNARRWFFRHRRREVDLDTGPEDCRNWTDVLADHSRSPFEMALDHERQALIEAALQQLNPVYREAVVLRDLADLGYEEIAAVLNVSLGTVKSRILRGREALRQGFAANLEHRPAMPLVPKTAE